MNIEILGTGCHDCLKLERLVHEVLDELGVRDAKVTWVNDERIIRRAMPPDETPGFVIDGILVSSHVVPDRETLRAWLAKAE